MRHVGCRAVHHQPVRPGGEPVRPGANEGPGLGPKRGQGSTTPPIRVRHPGPRARRNGGGGVPASAGQAAARRFVAVSSALRAAVAVEGTRRCKLPPRQKGAAHRPREACAISRPRHRLFFRFLLHLLVFPFFCPSRRPRRRAVSILASCCRCRRCSPPALLAALPASASQCRACDIAPRIPPTNQPTPVPGSGSVCTRAQPLLAEPKWTDSPLHHIAQPVAALTHSCPRAAPPAVFPPRAAQRYSYVPPRAVGRHETPSLTYLTLVARVPLKPSVCGQSAQHETTKHPRPDSLALLIPALATPCPPPPPPSLGV